MPLTHPGSGFTFRDMGGGLNSSPANIGQGIQASVNPQLQSALKTYSAMPTEKLQEMAAQYGNSPQGQILNRLLQSRRMGQSQAPQQQAAPSIPFGPAPQQMGQPQMRRGGGLTRLAAGGNPMGISMGMASPWWEKADVRSDSGLLRGETPGRADQLLSSAPSGSYVLPADVVSHLGEGNTLAGAKVWDSILHSNPYGIEGSPSRGGLPKARANARPPGLTMNVAKGGGVQGRGIAAQHIPVALSDGEILVSPQDVLRLGRGNLKHGHKILDAFVLKVRKDHIDTLKKLKPPVGAKAA